MNFLKQRLKHSAQSRSGFTLVELLVVLVILAILAAFTTPAMLGFVEDARGKAVIAEAREVYVAAQSAATEGKGDISFVKIKEMLKNDIGDFEEYDVVISDTNSPPVIWEPATQRRTGRIGIQLGLKDTAEQGIVKWIEYIDNSKSYLVKITPGGSAEVTKIK